MARCLSRAVLFRGEHRVVGASVAPQVEQTLAHGGRQEHLAHLAALAEDRELHLVLALDHVGPGQPLELGDAQASYRVARRMRSLGDPWREGGHGLLEPDPPTSKSQSPWFASRQGFSLVRFW